MKLVGARSIGKFATLPLLLILGGCLTAGGEVDGEGNPSPGPDGNSAPIITGNPATAITIGHVYTFVPSASDPDSDTLSFTVQNLPSWASFDSTTGRISGQPLLGSAGSYSDITITASDGSESTSLRPFSVTVTQSSLGSASLTLIAPAVNTDGTPFTDLSAFRIYFGTSVEEFPNEVYIPNPGISEYVVENLAPGTYYFVATAINRYGIESEFSNTVTRLVE